MRIVYSTLFNIPKTMCAPTTQMTAYNAYSTLKHKSHPRHITHNRLYDIDQHPCRIFKVATYIIKLDYIEKRATKQFPTNLKTGLNDYCVDVPLSEDPESLLSLPELLESFAFSMTTAGNFVGAMSSSISTSSSPASTPASTVISDKNIQAKRTQRTLRHKA